MEYLPFSPCPPKRKLKRKLSTTSENVERLKAVLDVKIAKALKVLYVIKENPNTDAWDLGVQEGQLLTLEYARRELENDIGVRMQMFEATMERLISARTK